MILIEETKVRAAVEAFAGYRREMGDHQPCDAEKALSEVLLSAVIQVAELQELAKHGPYVTQDHVLAVACMDPAEMRRRLIRQCDWHGHFAHSLDGIEEIASLPGAGIDGCRSHKEVRAVVTELLKKIERLNSATVTTPAPQPAKQEPTDSMGMPLSCGKPFCSPGEHHRLCKLYNAPVVQQTKPEEGLRCKIVENCKSCQYSAGRLSCMLANRRFDSLERSPTPPDWCPLPVLYPAPGDAQDCKPG